MKHEPRLTPGPSAGATMTDERMPLRRGIRSSSLLGGALLDRERDHRGDPHRAARGRDRGDQGEDAGGDEQHAEHRPTGTAGSTSTGSPCAPPSSDWAPAQP